jgi:Flp pilus assembly protein TadG
MRPGLCRRARRGASALEVAAIMPVAIAFLLGTVEFGRVYWSRSSLQFAVDQTGRHAMANPGLGNEALRSYLRGQAIGLDPNAIAVSFSSDTVGGVGFVTINATTPFNFIAYFALGPIQLRGSVRVPQS